tara:strand:+ start:87 stop:356 length:270 start_codon:yes stop_codon:yes gene_type:complete
MNLSELKTQLRSGEVRVIFKKKNGDTRIMLCTLAENIIGQEYQKEVMSGKKSNPDVLPVWDVEKKGWRSFRLDSIVKVVDGDTTHAYRG